MIETYDTAPDKRRCQKVLLLIDEAGTVGLPSLPQYAATVAGRGISLWVAIQEFSQLDDLYGRYKARTLKNNMGSKIYYRQEDDETAASIERALGRRSAFAHSSTTHHGEETSESLGEQAVSLLTARDITELSYTDIIAFFSNRKPFRGRRMDWRDFPELVRRHGLPPPTLPALPQLSEMLLPSPREREWPQSQHAIDPDAIN